MTARDSILDLQTLIGKTVLGQEAMRGTAELWPSGYGNTGMLKHQSYDRKYPFPR